MQLQNIQGDYLSILFPNWIISPVWSTNEHTTFSVKYNNDGHSTCREKRDELVQEISQNVKKLCAKSKVSVRVALHLYEIHT